MMLPYDQIAEQDIEQLDKVALLVRFAKLLCEEQQQKGVNAARQYPELFVEWAAKTIAKSHLLKDPALTRIDPKREKTFRHYCIKRLQHAPIPAPFKEGTVTELAERGRPYKLNMPKNANMNEATNPPPEPYGRLELALGNLVTDAQKLDSEALLDKRRNNAKMYHEDETESRRTIEAVVNAVVHKELRQCFYEQDYDTLPAR